MRDKAWYIRDKTIFAAQRVEVADRASLSQCPDALDVDTVLIVVEK